MPSRATRQELLAAVRALRPTADRIVVGIGGQGGAGKTTLATWLAGAADGVVVHLDDFARPGVEGFDWQRSLDQLIAPLREGRSARYQRWNWETNRGAEWHDVGTEGLVIVEGVVALSATYGPYRHLGVWVDAPYDLRVARGVARDGEAMRSMWTGVWEPEERAYIERERPDLVADLVIDGSA